MSRLSPTEHRTIAVVDVADFTNPDRNVADLVAVQEGLYNILHIAFAESGVDLDSCDVEDRGDGALIMIPPWVSKSMLADRLPDRLVAVLRRYNAVRLETTRLKLRVGIHAGDVRRNENGWVGHAVNLASRILEAPEVKAALLRSDGPLALIASDYFYNEVIEHDPGLAPETYRRIEISVKTFSGSIWLRIPGETIPTPTRLTSVSDGWDDDTLDFIPREELETIRDWLADLEIPHMAALTTRAVGPAIRPPHHGSAWDIFRYLTDFNAGLDGVPPSLAFLKLLASAVGGEFQTKVSAWVDKQTRRLRLAPVPDDVYIARQRLDVPDLHLMIAVEPQPSDPGRWRLSSWRQEDPHVWPPTRGGVREVALDELEYRVDEIVLDAEQAWADQAAAAVIEFVLPRDLLTLPVYQWCKEHASGEPRPLALDYQLRLRSLERMRNTAWHRRWKMRWEEVSRRPSLDRIYPFGPSSTEERIDAVLSDPRWVGLVMEQPPSPLSRPAPVPDPLTAALRAGLPFICWHPTARPEEVRQQINWLLEGDRGLADLPERHRTAVLAAPARPGGRELVYDWAVLWDDPYRVVDLDSAPAPSRFIDIGSPPALYRADVIESPRLPIANIGCPVADQIGVGQPIPVSFALSAGTDPEITPPLPRPVRLRILLDASGAATSPVTHVTWLTVERSTAPATFTVTPTTAGAVTLTFRVYRDSDSQLLMEVTTQLPVAEPAGKTVG